MLLFGGCCQSSDGRPDATGDRGDYGTPNVEMDAAPVAFPVLGNASLAFVEGSTHSEPPQETFQDEEEDQEKGKICPMTSSGRLGSRLGEMLSVIPSEPGANTTNTALGTLVTTATKILDAPDRLKALQDFLTSTYRDSIEMLEEDLRTLRHMKGLAQSTLQENTAKVIEDPDQKNQSQVEIDKASHAKAKLLHALRESVPSRSLQIDVTNPGKIHEQYDIMKKLGNGAFGEVSLARVKATGAQRAVKTISKVHTQGGSLETWNLLLKEIDVCKMVDHPNVIRLYEIFDDPHYLHLVMELCSGGSLHDYLRPAGFDENQAAAAMVQILRGVHYLHNDMICHRDLKPENVLVISKDSSDVKLFNFKHKLRIVDFGISCVFKKNQVLTAHCGTPGYMAPEVGLGKYNYLCDVWSVGAIMWRLMGGRWPSTLSAKMLDTRPGPGWEAGRSKAAQQLTKALLDPEPAQRILLSKALSHDWILQSTGREDYVPLDNQIVKSLRRFRGLNKFKKAALNIMASMMSEEQIRVPRNAFLELDSDGDGSISMAELRETLLRWKKAGMNDNEIDAAVVAVFFKPGESHRHNKQFKQEMAVLHKSSSWKADKSMPNFSYTEFLAATLNPKHLNEAICRVAFQSFDKDGSGTLSKEELVLGRLLGQLGPDERDQLIQDLDKNGDGEIDFNEFCAMMKENEGWHQCFEGGSHIEEDDAPLKVLSSLQIGTE